MIILSTWLGHGAPTYLVKHYFWVCLWGYFQKRWTFELVEWVKQNSFPSVGGHHPIYQRSEQNKKVDERRIHPLCPMVDLGHWSSVLRLWPTTLVLLVLRIWDLDQNLYHQQSGSQAFGHGLQFMLSVFMVLNPSDLNELIFTNLEKTTVVSSTALEL